VLHRCIAASLHCMPYTSGGTPYYPARTPKIALHGNVHG
jgi:hypothetical protein